MGFLNDLVDRYTGHDKTKEELKGVKKQFEDIRNSFNQSSRFGGMMAASPPPKSGQFLDSYRNWVYANVRALAQPVSHIQLKLYRVVRNEPVELVEHPALELINKVNPYMTKSDLFNLTQTYLDMLGEAVWYLSRGGRSNGKPIEIWPLRPDFITIVPGDVERGEPFIKEYKYRAGSTGEEQTFQPNEIIFFKYPDPTNIFRGMSPIKAAATYVDIDEFSAEWNRVFFLNSAQVDAVLSTDRQLDDMTIKRLKAELQNFYGGIRNARKTMVLEEGLKYDPAVQSRRDMEFIEQARWSRDTLMAFFGTTKTVLGITDDVNRANAEASEYVFSKYAIKSRMQKIVEYLNEFLLPMYGQDLFFGFEDPVPDNREQRVLEYEKGWNKWLTTNDIRNKENLPPVEGGDTLYIPITFTPLGQPIEIRQLMVSKKARKKELHPEVVRLMNRKSKTKKLAEIILKEYKKQAIPMAKKIIESRKSNTILKQLKTEQQQYEESLSRNDRFWIKQVKINENYEERFVSVIDQILTDQEKEVLTNIQAIMGGKSVKVKVDNRLLFNKKEWVKTTIDLLTPLMTDIVETQGNAAYDFLGITDEYDFLGAAKRFIERNTYKFAQSMTDTQLDQLKRGLQEAIDAGESVPKISARVREIFTGMRKNNSIRIARTETSRATNFATVDAYKQSGVVTGKQWLTAMDERVDGDCAELEGKVIDIDDDFFKKGDELPDGTVLDYSNVGYPPLHPNCRCTVVPIILGERSQKESIQKQIDEHVGKMKDEIKSEVKEELENAVAEKLEKALADE